MEETLVKRIGIVGLWQCADGQFEIRAEVAPGRWLVDEVGRGPYRHLHKGLQRLEIRAKQRRHMLWQ